MPEEKSKLEKTIEEGIYGEREIKKEEKQRYLGEFEERVIKYLTYEQVMEPGTYPEILDAIKDDRAAKIVIDRQVELSHAQDYIKLARENDLTFKRIDSPRLKGNIGLVVASDTAVDSDGREIMDRKDRLQSLGISDNIIKNVGAKLCKDCWQELKEKAPWEIDNYDKISWIEKLSGTRCINCDDN